MDHIITDPAMFDHIEKDASTNTASVTSLHIPVAILPALIPSTPEQNAARAEWLHEEKGIWEPNEKAQAILEAAGDVMNPALRAACDLDALSEIWDRTMEIEEHTKLLLTVEEAADQAADRFVAAIRVLAGA